jgi:Flp pilus assembly protein TadD
MSSRLGDCKGRNQVARLWVWPVFLILCATPLGCATSSHRENKEEALTHFNQGRELRAKGNLKGAIVEYRAALHLDPNHVDAHTNLGAALGTKGDVEGAIAEHRTALRLDPIQFRPHYNLGIALQAQGKKADAKDEFMEALRLLPDTRPIKNTLDL